jgi:hypothetical protein
MSKFIVISALVLISATAFVQVHAHVEDNKTPQLFCGSSKSSSGTYLDGDEITYFATINNISGPFAVHLYMKRVDCSPSCDPSVFSIFAADGKVMHPAPPALDIHNSFLNSAHIHNYLFNSRISITVPSPQRRDPTKNININSEKTKQ